MRTLFALLGALLLSACAENAEKPETQVPGEAPAVQTEIETVSYQLSIKGMSCGHCAKAVKTILEAQPGVESAEVDHEGGTASVRVKAGSALDEAAVRDALDKEMYELTACTVTS